MSDNRIYYHLHPSTSDPCELTRKAYAEAESSWLCMGCLSPKPDSGAIDVQIDESKVRDKPLNFIAGTALPLAQRSFLYQMGNDVIARDLLLGRVYGPDGDELEDWCTYRGRRIVIVRGSDEDDCKAGYRRCEDCGRIVYFALGTSYLFPSPPPDAEVYEGAESLVVPDYLFNRLEIPKKAKIYVDRLQVLDAPLDGLGILE